jgi:hypothetical protein
VAPVDVGEAPMGDPMQSKVRAKALLAFVTFFPDDLINQAMQRLKICASSG